MSLKVVAFELELFKGTTTTVSNPNKSEEVRVLVVPVVVMLQLQTRSFLQDVRRRRIPAL